MAEHKHSVPEPPGPPGVVQRPGPGFNPGGRPGWGQHPPFPLGGGNTPVRQVANPTNRLAMPNAPSNDAQAGLISYLSQFGLQSLAGWAWNEYVRLGGGQAAMDQITLDLPNQKAYQDRFPAIALRARAGLPQLSPAEYLSYEASLDQELALVGAPSAIRAGTAQFRDIVTKGLAGDVSINEMQARIEGGYQAVRDADPSVRNWFAQKYGVQGDQALAAYFLAPEHAESTLSRIEREAEIGGAGGRAGIDVSVETAGQVAAINPSGDVNQQFQRLAELDPLFHQRVSESGQLSAAQQGVAAEFGTDATSAAAIQRRLEERAASAAGGTAITSDQTGLTGVGTAR